MSSLGATETVGDILASVAAEHHLNVTELSAEDKLFLVEHAGHDQQHAQMALILLSVLVASQIGITIWKKINERSFKIATVVGLWLVPALLGIQGGNYRYIFFWFLFSLCNGLIIQRSLQRPLKPSTPRLVYQFYHWIYTICSSIGGFGYFLIITSLFGLPSIVGVNPESAFAGGIIMMFYGLYFGILGRDIVERVSDNMAVSLGYYSRVGFPAKNLKAGVCAICGDRCKSEGIPMMGPSEHERAYNHQNPSDVDQTPQATIDGLSTVTLNCQHTFHEQCIRGWTIIGKKDCCPNCKEKVDLKAFSRNPWETTQLLYLNFLDYIRILFVWNPVAFFAVHVIFQVLGYK